MLIGLVGVALIVPALNFVTSFFTAAVVMVPMWMIIGMFITPSMAYFAQLASQAGVRAYGVVYGIYNVAWAVGLMSGPALGGFLFEQIGFAQLTLVWSALLIFVTLLFARI
jgi:predicted MFS family arabinose efflux permease